MNKFSTFAVGLVATASLVATNAMAALPADVTTALADMKTDGATLAGAFLVVCIVIGAIKILKKGAN